MDNQGTEDKWNLYFQHLERQENQAIDAVTCRMIGHDYNILGDLTFTLAPRVCNRCQYRQPSALDALHDVTKHALVLQYAKLGLISPDGMARCFGIKL